MAAVLTREQRKGCFKLYIRTITEETPTQSYLQFRRKAEFSHIMGCLMVPYFGMWAGIEPDGYTHS